MVSFRAGRSGARHGTAQPPGQEEPPEPHRRAPRYDTRGERRDQRRDFGRERRRDPRQDPYQDGRRADARNGDPRGWDPRQPDGRHSRDRRHSDRRHDDRRYDDRRHEEQRYDERAYEDTRRPERNGRRDARHDPGYDDRRPRRDDRPRPPRDDRTAVYDNRTAAYDDRTRGYPERTTRPRDPARDHGRDPRGDARRQPHQGKGPGPRPQDPAVYGAPRARNGRDSSGDLAPDARFESAHRPHDDRRSSSRQGPPPAGPGPSDQGRVYGGQRANRSNPPSDRPDSEHHDEVFAWQEEPADDGVGFFGDDEEVDDSRLARHRRRKQKGRDRRRSLLALGVVVLLVAALGGIGYFGFDTVTGWFAAPDYDGNGNGEVTVEIAQGQSTTAIGNTLTKAGVVKSPKAFVNAAEDNPKALTLRPGTYKLRKQMKGTAALALLLDPASRISQGVTLPEGLNLAESLKKISEATGIPLADLQKAAKEPASLGLPAWAKPLPPRNGAPAAKLPPEAVLEGFLFPDTYEVNKNSNATELLRTMVNQSVQAMEQIDFVGKAEKVNLSPYEALVVASVLEEEGIAKDFSKIARVIYNREKAEMSWGMDSTVNYVNKTKTLNPSASQLNVESAYNTRKYRGFPPTPISAPGKAALTAAVEPAAGPWLYFVKYDKDGNSAFATTLAEHERNTAQARKNGAFAE
jgi:UPF0755 protein